MKKSILALAIMAFASITASAASILWTTDALSFDGSVLKSNSAVKGYLLYLSEGTLGTYDVTPAFTASVVGDPISRDIDGTSKAGKAAAKFTFDFGDYNNGDVFAVLVSYTDAENTTWWNLSTATQSLSGIEDTSSVYEGPAFTFNSEFSNPENKLTAGGGWAKAVPEPATGALALAGLALLFRRKRA